MTTNFYRTHCLAVGIVLMQSINAWGLPDPYKGGDGVSIINSTIATVISDNRDSKLHYVLPPTAGFSQMEDFTPSSNLGFCEGTRHLFKAANTVVKRISEHAEKVELFLAELDTAAEQRKKSQQRVLELAVGESVQELNSLQTHLENLEFQRQELGAKLNNCRRGCSSLKFEDRQLRRQIMEARREIHQYQMSHHGQFKSYRDAQQQLRESEKIYDQINSDYRKKQQILTQLEKDVMALFSNRRLLEGGRANISFDLGWDQAVLQLRASNPGHVFKKIPTYNAQLMANIVSNNDAGARLNLGSDVLSYSIVGLEDHQPGRLGSNYGDQYPDSGGAGLPSILMGSVIVSLPAGCMMAHKNFTKGTGLDPEMMKDGIPLFSIGVKYRYPVVFGHKVTVTYNLFKMYEKVETLTEQGGFFSSSSYGELINEAKDDAVFKVEWTESDPTNEVPEATRRKIETEIKQDIINRVLSELGEPLLSASTTPEFAKPTVSRKTGAMVLAEGLDASCGWNIFCRAGAYGLKALATSLSKTETRQKLSVKWDRTITESWSETAAKLRDGASTYVTRK
jgi:hypothetical protein